MTFWNNGSDLCGLGVPVQSFAACLQPNKHNENGTMFVMEDLISASMIQLLFVLSGVFTRTWEECVRFFSIKSAKHTVNTVYYDILSSTLCRV